MRIEGLEGSQTSWLLRPLYLLLRQRFGKVLTPYKVWAHRPGATIGMAIAMSAIESPKGLDP